MCNGTPAQASKAGDGEAQGAPKKFQLTHAKLDRTLQAGLALAVLKFGSVDYLKKVAEGFRTFPYHYSPVFDWAKKPMDKFVASSVLMLGWYFLLKTYVVERQVVKNAHKKYAAHHNTAVVAAHGGGSALEITIGCLACMYPQKAILTKIASLLAVNNIITGFKLTKGVFGIKHLTVPGFYLFGVLRAIEIFRTLHGDLRNYPQAWILLQVGTIVRLLGFYVLPFSSYDGERGDLFTEPSIYSFNILLSGYLASMFVYPPKYVIASLGLYVYWQGIQPYRISMRRRPRHEGAEGQVGVASVANKLDTAEMP